MSHEWVIAAFVAASSIVSPMNRESSAAQVQSTEGTPNKGIVQLIDGRDYDIVLPTGKQYRVEASNLFTPDNQTLNTEKRKAFEEKPYYNPTTHTDRIGYFVTETGQSSDGSFQTKEGLYVHNYRSNGHELPGTGFDELVNSDGTTNYIGQEITITDPTNYSSHIRIDDSVILNITGLDLQDPQDNKKYAVMVIDWEIHHPGSVFFLTCANPEYDAGGNITKSDGEIILAGTLQDAQSADTPIEGGGGGSGGPRALLE